MDILKLTVKEMKIIGTDYPYIEIFGMTKKEAKQAIKRIAREKGKQERRESIQPDSVVSHRHLTYSYSIPTHD